MPRLNDTQLILLSSAAQRADASLFPLPVILSDAGPRASTAIDALLKFGFVEERETSEPGAISRADGDIRYGIFVTAAGLSVIDNGPSDENEVENLEQLPARRGSKSELVITLLERGEGAI